MLISLLLENFRSFADEQELSAVANGKHQNLTDHLVALPGHDEKVVPVVAIYGPNGAGKSNVVRALYWLRRELNRAAGEFTSRERNLFLDATRATRLVVRFWSIASVYEYGVTLVDHRVETEWLSEVTRGGVERSVFERRTSDQGTTTVEYGKGFSSQTEKFAALRVLGALPGQLFLTRVWRDVHDEELPECFRAPLEWFDRLVIVRTEDVYRPLGSRIHEEAGFRSEIAQLLKDSGTGVEDVSSDVVEIITVSELNDQELDSFERKPVGSSFARRGKHILVKLADERVAVQRVVAVHHGSTAPVRLPFEEESDGTQRLAHLAPALYEADKAPNVFVVDELDRSLHAVLVKEFVGAFLSRAKGHRSQLIFTTHETHALDQALLRRDEVWFVEKNRDGASELYSLDDFPVRTDLRLDRSYLQGRFGAVPNVRAS